MKIAFLAVFLSTASYAAEESYFLRRSSVPEPSSLTVYSHDKVPVPIVKIPVKIDRILVYHETTESRRTYVIEMEVTGDLPPKVGPPELMLGGDWITDLKRLSHVSDGSTSLVIESPDRKQVEKWLNSLRAMKGQKHFKVVGDLGKTQAEQDAPSNGG